VHNNKFTKVEYRSPAGIKLFKLYDDELGEITPITEYLQLVARGNPPKNTLVNKGSDITKFFRYLLAFDVSFFENHNQYSRNSVTLREIVLQYPEYLTTPSERCTGHFSKYAIEKNDTKPVSKSSAGRYLTTVNEFLNMSAKFHDSIESLKKKDLVDIDTDENVFSEFFDKKELSSVERNHICKNSVMAAVLKGGAKYSNSAIFKAPKISGREANKNVVQKAFPVRNIIPLIEHASDIRDKMLWSLLAGTGVRVSEALQILISDIDIPNERVYVIDPSDRRHLYYGVDNEQMDSASYKGRISPTTYFINPFRDIFFAHLQEYLELRWSTHPDHECFFVSLSNANAGSSLIGSRELNEKFKASPYNIQAHTLHSLRHFYGVWCRNFIKRGPNKFGFPVATVMSLMGQSSERSTDIYAIKEEHLLQTEIQYANELMSGEEKGNIELNVMNALKYKLSLVEEQVLGLSR